MKHILFVSQVFPTNKRPYFGSFVKQLVNEICNTNIKCSVINPASIFDIRHGFLDDKIVQEKKGFDIYRPRYVSISNKKMFNKNTRYFTWKLFERSVFKAYFKYISDRIDIVYGHFINPAGLTAISLAKKIKKPSVVALGESSFNFYMNDNQMLQVAKDNLQNASGFISVSEQNTLECKNLFDVPDEKILTIPNAVDLSVFKPLNKIEMRRKYALPLNKTIVSFTGHFIERKGPNRLLNAIENEKDIGAVLIGDGNMELNAESILFKEKVEHQKVPELLSASDIFVLPTLAEGCSNAIIEAMACGLPVITSDYSFNDEILNDKVSLRVDPLNIKEINKAIMYLHNNPEIRSIMASAALEQAKGFDLKKRARAVMDYLNQIESLFYNKAKYY